MSTPHTTLPKAALPPSRSTPPVVGFFDSGIGGISIVREFRKLRPDVDILYVADWDYCPYGDKTGDVILERAHHITRRLLANGARLIVVACNTATAVAIDSLRATFPDVPFVGMEPAVKPAALRSATGVVGILATPGTFQGRLFKETSARFAHNTRIETAVGRGFVELVESGDFDSDHARAVVAESLAPLLEKGADHIVLGCTHYPFLKPIIAAVAGLNVTLVDPSEAVARRAAALLDTL